MKPPALQRIGLRVVVGLFPFVACCVLACGGGDATDDGARIDAKGIAEIEALADKVVSAGIPGVSLAVLRDDQTLVSTRGVANRETGAALSAVHRFRMAGITQSLVASVVLQLVEEGRLQLHDSVDQWLPGLLPENGDATLELLLRQESGIFDYAADERLMDVYVGGDLEHAWTPEQLVRLAAEHAPLFAPGTRHAASDTNYTLLGLIVEKVTGAALDEVVAERITHPLGLTATRLATTSQLDAPYAHGYLMSPTGTLDVTGFNASAVWGSGNLVSTPRDLARFFRALAQAEVVSAEQLPDMLRVDPNLPSTDYAMGVARLDDHYPCGAFIGHDGGIPGYESVAYSSLDGQRQFALVVNSGKLEDEPVSEDIRRAFEDLSQALACR